ncbi:MAG: hypothetical protein ACE5G0_06465 [Rhodothermales bacterium]
MAEASASDLFSTLYTTNFTQYLTALKAIRELLDAGDRPEMGKDDFLMLLRPYYWFPHRPGFQDIYDTCENAMMVMKNYVDTLFDKKLNPITGNPFLAMGTFLAVYLDEGRFDPSGWRKLFASPEISASVIADEFGGKLEAANTPEEDVQALRSLAALMRDIEGSKHITYWCLRHLGADFLEELSIIHGFPAGDQSTFFMRWMRSPATNR